MEFPENKTEPPSIITSSGIVQIKSCKVYTSMYPPTLSTLKLVPVSLFLVTEKGAFTIDAEVGFLYWNAIFFIYKYCFFMG